MKIGDLIYHPHEKVFGVILSSKDDIILDYCWILEDRILMKEGFHYGNIMEYWREAQKLAKVNYG